MNQPDDLKEPQYHVYTRGPHQTITTFDAETLRAQPAGTRALEFLWSPTLGQYVTIPPSWVSVQADGVIIGDDGEIR